MFTALVFILLTGFLALVGAASTVAQTNVIEILEAKVATTAHSHSSATSMVYVRPGATVYLSGGAITEGKDRLFFGWKVKEGPYSWIYVSQDDKYSFNAGNATGQFKVPNQAFIDGISDSDPGKYKMILTLTATQGDAQKTASVTVNILSPTGEPPPNYDPEYEIVSASASVGNQWDDVVYSSVTAQPNSRVFLDASVITLPVKHPDLRYQWTIKTDSYSWITITENRLFSKDNLRTPQASFVIPNSAFIADISGSDGTPSLVVEVTLTATLGIASDTATVIVRIDPSSITPASTPQPQPAPTSTTAPKVNPTPAPTQTPQPAPIPAPTPTPTPTINPADTPQQPSNTQTTAQITQEISRLRTIVQQQQTLIVAQENLLNSYRCLFNVDTQIVPQGCETVIAN